MIKYLLTKLGWSWHMDLTMLGLYAMTLSQIFAYLALHLPSSTNPLIIKLGAIRQMEQK